ncbi:lipoprotein [soil metagenome]
MRKIFTVIALLSLGSCLQESSSTPAESSTFIRYFNGGNNDTAQAMEVTADGGFIILATTTVKKTDADKPKNKIKLIRTDKFGNQVWQSLFPAATDTTKNYTASSLQILPDGGYVITGEDIQTNNTNKILLMTVNDSGEATGAPTSLGAFSSGRAVAADAQGYFVLSTSGQDLMRLSKVDKNNLSTILWSKEYTAGVTLLARRLFVDEQGKLLWAGAANKSGLIGIRMIKTLPNSENTDFDLLISVPGINEVAFDFCRFGFTYAIVGSTNQKGTTAGADTDILFKRLNSDGTVLSTQSFPFDGQNDVGNSISSTSDGGLILLASVNSTGLGKAGQGDNDYYLIKIDGFGGTTWTSSFGSRFKDDGVTVRQATDGGYVVLGTTTQGGIKLLSLMKTDKNGKIQ